MSPYTPPQVTVQEITAPSVSPLLASPNTVAVVGLAQGYITVTDLVVLNPGVATALPTLASLGASASLVTVLSVTDQVHPGNAPNTDGTYRLTNDYTVQQAAGTVTSVLGSGGGLIPSGEICAVKYTYVPSDYFQPIRLSDLGSIQARFGDAWNASGINSPLSFGAAMALANGASDVICQPLFYNQTASDPTSTRLAPTVGSSATVGTAANAATWAETYYALRPLTDVSILIPIFGQNDPNITETVWTQIAEAAQDHLKYMHDQQVYIEVFWGEDASNQSSYGQMPQIRSNATTLGARYGGLVSQQCTLINTAKFGWVNPLTNTATYVGGQYVAAAYAGVAASRPIGQPLTRAPLSGIASLADYRGPEDKNTDASGGLSVIDQRGLNIFVRHALTLDTSSVANAELSVVRAKHYMMRSVRNTLDGLIGTLVADNNAPTVVKTAVIAVLEALVGSKALVAYTNVQARLLQNLPTTIEVRFGYSPAFPVNYINVLFSLDLTNGQITVQPSTALSQGS